MEERGLVWCYLIDFSTGFPLLLIKDNKSFSGSLIALLIVAVRVQCISPGSNQ